MSTHRWEIGHVEKFVFDHVNWTSVTLASTQGTGGPESMSDLALCGTRDRLGDRHVELNITRAQVKASPLGIPSQWSITPTRNSYTPLRLAGLLVYANDSPVSWDTMASAALARVNACERQLDGFG